MTIVFGSCRRTTDVIPLLICYPGHVVLGLAVLSGLGERRRGGGVEGPRMQCLGHSWSFGNIQAS